MSSRGHGSNMGLWLLSVCSSRLVLAWNRGSAVVLPISHRRFASRTAGKFPDDPANLLPASFLTCGYRILCRQHSSGT